MASLRDEIVGILAAHAEQPIDYVAIFMFLNTVAGGHYEDRWSETAIRTELDAMMAGGLLVQVDDATGSHYTLKV
ncbi:MAG TPA: hypothetical protein VN709_07040 [Terriglobales bacterium]|nr:hypothetical protein [Terriglobales bacterium]